MGTVASGSKLRDAHNHHNGPFRISRFEYRGSKYFQRIFSVVVTAVVGVLERQNLLFGWSYAFIALLGDEEKDDHSEENDADS